MAMGLASALGGFKNAKSAKGAKGANPWKLALLALLGRAGNLLIVAEAGAYPTDCGMESIRSFLGGFKTAKDANPGETATTASRGDAEDAEGKLGKTAKATTERISPRRPVACPCAFDGPRLWGATKLRAQRGSWGETAYHSRSMLTRSRWTWDMPESAVTPCGLVLPFCLLYMPGGRYNNPRGFKAVSGPCPDWLAAQRRRVHRPSGDTAGSVAPPQAAGTETHDAG